MSRGIGYEEAMELARKRSDCEPRNLAALASLAREMDVYGIPGAIVECGSYKCGASIALASASPRRHVFACDLFGGLPYGPGRGFDNFGAVDWDEVRAATAPFDNLHLIRGRHEETIEALEGRFCLVFMDSDHYESHSVCLRHLWPRVSLGGAIVFHDWGFEEVQRAIRERIHGEIYERGRMVDSPNMGMIRKRLPRPGIIAASEAETVRSGEQLLYRD